MAEIVLERVTEHFSHVAGTNSQDSDACVSPQGSCFDNTWLLLLPPRKSMFSSEAVALNLIHLLFSERKLYIFLVVVLL